MVTAAPAPASAAPRAPEAAPLAQPPALAAGDAVALFSPSSHSGREAEAHLERARALLEGWGLRPRALPARQARHLYLAGPDALRAEEFQRLYCDPQVKALFASRGGYGAARLLPHLDAVRIAAAPPKAVVGMSDVVALFAWLHAAAGVGALHGPCLAAPGSSGSPHEAENLADLRAELFGAPRPTEFACTLLHAGAGTRTAPSAAPGGTPGAGTSTAPGAAGGSAAGRLVGGNLAVLASLLGTPWALQSAGCILFLEDVNEPPYRVDRMLTQFRQAGRLDGVAGLVFGYLQGCDGDPPGLLHDVLRDLFAQAPYPVAIGLEAGHGPRNRTLALGRRARLAWQAPQPGAAATLAVH
jgi:muramoyltetrapeptide carboxypeptidase